MATDVAVTPAAAQLPMQIPENPGNVKCIETQELAQLFGLEKSLSNDDLVAIAVQEYDGAVYSMARAGAALLIIKTRVDWGKFLPTLGERGISSQRASEMMRVAERLSELPEDEAKRIAAMRPAVVIALARFTAQELLWASKSGKVPVLAKMKAPQIAEWRRQRRLGYAPANSKQDEEVAEAEANRKPLELEAATDEVIGGVARAQIELQRVKQTIEALLPKTNDHWKEARTDLAHAARRVIVAISEEAADLEKLLFDRFGTGTLPSEPRQYHALASSHLDALGTAALESAEADTHARTVRRNGRVTPKPKGAAPKTLAALLAKFKEETHG